MALGLLNPGLSYALALVGLSLIAASTSVLIWASEPALIVLLAFLFLHERLTRRLAAALAMALFGVLLVVYSGGVSGSPVGILLTLAAVLACAVYTVLARIWAVDDAALPITLDQQTAALAFALVLATAVAVGGGGQLTGPVPLSDVSAGAWAAALVIGADVLRPCLLVLPLSTQARIRVHRRVVHHAGPRLRGDGCACRRRKSRPAAVDRRSPGHLVGRCHRHRFCSQQRATTRRTETWHVTGHSAG